MTGPCAGLRVVELARGTSDLGLGLAGGLPGMVLADLGAEVVRVVGVTPVPLDAGLGTDHTWHRDKRVVDTDDDVEVAALLAGADVALVYGPEAVVERAGLGYEATAAGNPSVVYARCRPSRTADGEVDDFGLLVEARAGFCTQLAGHRPGPIFADVRATDAGTSFLLLTSVLALLRRRDEHGVGGWSETSLYDGMLATLGTMIGRSQTAPPEVEGYWEKGSTFPNFLYRCADDELVQVWFGGKGMYDKLIEVLGDEPSTDGYYADQVNGMLTARAQRWKDLFVRQDRATWIEQLRAAGVACEPVLAPGEALHDPHLAAVGLRLDREVGGHHDAVVGTPITVTPVDAPDGRASGERPPAAVSPSGSGRPTPPAGGLLAGVKVADFSAFVAGPLGAQVLADLGADVIKVEPPGGEAMRAAAYAVAACQRGKRSLALDLGSPEARPVVDRLLAWADVVLHNFRVGVSSRLGIDEARVVELNPGAVYCHASAFGPHGPRAKFPGNDALMQAITGFERAVGGEGNEPLAATWIPIDMVGGWVGATGTLAGLYARATTGEGQRVATSLLGAGMLLQSGTSLRDDEVVPWPGVDGDQTGYGPGYRIYRCSDDAWLALVLSDEGAWDRAVEVTAAAVPAGSHPLRGGADDAEARAAEAAFANAFATGPAATWVARLRAADVPVEPVAEMDRDRFRRAILDDPVNQQLGRVASFEALSWGRLDHIGRLVRTGPHAHPTTPLNLPDVGEHTTEVLTDLGFTDPEVAALLDAEVARQG